MKEKGIIIIDWRHGYNVPEALNDPGYQVAFATPHSMIYEPRQSEELNLKLSLLSQKTTFNSEEEINILMENIRANPGYLDQELHKSKLTGKEMDYFTYRELLSKATKSKDISAMKFVLKSLIYTDEPIDSLIWIAKNVTERTIEKYDIYWKACTTSAFYSTEYAKNKEISSTCWTDHWYRPYMRGIASFYTFQICQKVSEKDKEQAIYWLRDTMKLDPADPMGIRFILMSLYSQLKDYKRMESIYKEFPADSQNPLFLYPMAHMSYKTKGDAHPDTKDFITQALESNIHIATRVFRIAKEAQSEDYSFEGSSYLPRSEEEARYFFKINSDIRFIDLDEQDWLHKSFQQHITDFQNKLFGAQA